MNKLNLLGVTACISGVAHTYMAAERLEKLASQENWSIKVETQGALGIENSITQNEINQCDLVIIISNINIKNREKFHLCRCIEMDISHFLTHATLLVNSVKKIVNLPKGTHFLL